MEFQTTYNRKPSEGFTNTEPSQTVQNDTYSILEILQRSAQGAPIAKHQKVFFDEKDMKKINKYFQPGALDLTDLDELKREISHLKTAINRAKHEKEKAKKAEKRKAEKEKKAEQKSVENVTPKGSNE